VGKRPAAQGPRDGTRPFPDETRVPTVKHSSPFVKLPVPRTFTARIVDPRGPWVVGVVFRAPGHSHPEAVLLVTRGEFSKAYLFDSPITTHVHCGRRWRSGGRFVGLAAHGQVGSGGLRGGGVGWAVRRGEAMRWGLSHFRRTLG
jgi:hypothetical protein